MKKKLTLNNIIKIIIDVFAIASMVGVGFVLFDYMKSLGWLHNRSEGKFFFTGSNILIIVLIVVIVTLVVVSIIDIYQRLKYGDFDDEEEN